MQDTSSFVFTEKFYEDNYGSSSQDLEDYYDSSSGDFEDYSDSSSEDFDFSKMSEEDSKMGGNMTRCRSKCFFSSINIPKYLCNLVPTIVLYVVILDDFLEYVIKIG